jgi:hypothetical protein
MNEIERLMAAEEIRNLRGKYSRAVDEKDRELLRSLFTKDAVADYRGSGIDPVTGEGFRPADVEEPMRGRDAIADTIAAATTGMVTVHHTAVGDIEVESADSARGTWPLVDRLLFPPGGKFRAMTGYGFYHETYAREDGVWKIKTLRVSRLRIDFTPA